MGLIRHLGPLTLFAGPNFRKFLERLDTDIIKWKESLNRGLTSRTWCFIDKSWRIELFNLLLFWQDPDVAENLGIVRTIEPRHFELSGKRRNSSRLREVEIVDSKLLKGKSKWNYFEFEITGTSKLNRVRISVIQLW